MMTPYQQVIRALRKENDDSVPFAVYEIMVPRGSVERDLRNRGLCLVRHRKSYQVYFPNVNIKAVHFRDKNGLDMIRTEYSTPLGDLSVLTRKSGFYLDWIIEHMFKSPDDYKALNFLIRDAVIVPDYDAVAKEISMLGEDYILRDQIGLFGLEPLQSFISSEVMNAQDFCIEWMENRDELIKLYNSVVEVNRKIYEVVADGPLQFANYGGNVVPQIIGVNTFNEFYVPNYNEAAEVLHKKGKLIGTHLDADNTIIMDEIGQTALDYIEAFDPAVGPSVKVAREKWPDKALWINWPSALQLGTLDEIRINTMRLIEEARPVNGFIVGVTEDVPEDRIIGNLDAIMKGVEAFKDSSCITSL